MRNKENVQINGAKLKSIIKNKKICRWTITDLSAKVHIDPDSLSRCIRTGSMAPEVLDKIGELLNVDPRLFTSDIYDDFDIGDPLPPYEWKYLNIEHPSMENVSRFFSLFLRQQMLFRFEPDEYAEIFPLVLEKYPSLFEDCVSILGLRLTQIESEYYKSKREK